jgi:putative Ca2+/H+ antiporter (TMEM165/GDT1 family)
MLWCMAHFLKWSAIIATGVVLATFITWIVSAMLGIALLSVVKSEVTALVRRSDTQVESAIAASQRAEAARQGALRQQRADSPQGRDLERRCAEFAKAEVDLRSSFAAEQREQACARRDRFLTTGRP